jgi:hypothetical protein
VCLPSLLPSTLFSTDSSDNVVAVYDKHADNDSDHSQPLDNDVGHDDIHVGNDGDRDRQFDLPVRHDSFCFFLLLTCVLSCF